jgi:hypothetical protein
MLTGQAFSQIEMAPYYNYQFAEGVSVSPDGDLGFLVNLSNDIGTIIKPFEEHRFIGFYSLKYQGPGLKKQEGREFSERYLDHLFVGRHHWHLDGNTVLKSQADILMEKRRSGTNESWEKGLYNFNRYGGSAILDRNIIKDLDTSFSFGYHFLTFPNYTDMLAEIRSGATDPSASEGKQNHHIFQIGTKGVYSNNAVSLGLFQQFYTKQKVAVDDVQSNGTYYSSEKQRDMTITLDAARQETLSEKTAIAPQLTFMYKNSNQNYQHFEEATSTTPVRFFSDFYDYTELTAGIPFSFAFNKKWSFIFSPELNFRYYIHRPPRDADGDFLFSKKQQRLLGIYTIGFKNRTGESSSSLLFFTFQHQSSNMKFERYITYNYTGFSAGIKFQMEY